MREADGSQRNSVDNEICFGCLMSPRGHDQPRQYGGNLILVSHNYLPTGQLGVRIMDTVL